MVVRADPAEPYGAVIHDTAVVTSATFDPNPANNTSTTSFVVMADRFVAQVFGDLLGRPPRAEEAATYSQFLASGGSRSQLAALILTGSEYRTKEVLSFFPRFLGRKPTPADQAFVNAVVFSALDLDSIVNLFISSPEYFAHAGGTNVDFVRRLYQDFLQRPASPGDLSAWTKLLAAPNGRAQVASSIRNSTEAIGRAVQGIFTQFLRRSADPMEANGVINLFRDGVSREAVLSWIIGSPEYLKSVAK
jgi:hypothetical protein